MHLWLGTKTKTILWTDGYYYSAFFAKLQCLKHGGQNFESQGRAQHHAKLKGIYEAMRRTFTERLI